MYGMIFIGEFLDFWKFGYIWYPNLFSASSLHLLSFMVDVHAMTFANAWRNELLIHEKCYGKMA